MVLGLIIAALYLIWGCNADVVHLLTRTERSFEDPKPEPPRPEYWDDPHFGSYFDNSTERNVTVYMGNVANLHCKIRQLGDRSIGAVSWVRQKDLHILTVGKYTYTSDQRFTSIHMENSEIWTLEIKYTQKKDAGVYECQVSTEPKRSLSIRLNVVVPKAHITEGPRLYIENGSTINLTCIITESTSPPVYLFWYHENRIISYDSSRGGIRITTENYPITVSRLQIQDARPTDSGSYSCYPSNTDPANITVHVLTGEKLGETQHGRSINVADSLQLYPIQILLAALLCTIFQTSALVIRR